MQAEGLGGDKCRTGTVGDKVIWSCGDMQCGNGTACGFSMGPAFYGSDDVMTINTDSITDVGDYTFATAWNKDPLPVAPQKQFGMDTSNVVEINSTHGVAFVWEIWRGASDSSIVDRGAGAVSVTLGSTKPIATRVGPLLSNGTALQLGLIAIMRADKYVYVYSAGGPSGVNVARVAASDDVFDASKYEFLVKDTQTWEAPGQIPDKTETRYGLTTQDSSGKFGCLVYGSAFYNADWDKYVILCNAYLSFTMMYVADKPEGPFSATYPVLNEFPGYGSHAHPHYGLNPLYFSLGPDGPFSMFKMTFKF
ncbi:hypothetical protein K461DRAFT_279239 [Myriangium duriaei CBS 260.36]|uniref:DUF4185 domain-containing protein n=1 Tax=Myriangium duriaei CBS 260.36 TaxID=1168546 RepID=A0A9P4J3K4_9PEZI|nr:hypothetical protein K461DRAFT_279239 [Myriangium duriaei CBS 260.36]